METDKIIILPSYNELGSLKKICKDFKKRKLNFIVLDDHSTDGSNKWLKKNNINFIRNKKNLGYEKNVLQGFKYAIEKKNIRHVITFDSDGEHKISDLLKIIKFLRGKDIDLLICNRKVMNRWSEYLLSFLFYLILNIKDPLSGLKVYNINIIKKFIGKIKKNYFLVDIIALVLKNNYKIKNYIINTNKTKHSRIGNNISTHVKILKCLKYLALNY